MAYASKNVGLTAEPGGISVRILNISHRCTGDTEKFEFSSIRAEKNDVDRDAAVKDTQRRALGIPIFDHIVVVPVMPKGFDVMETFSESYQGT